MSVAHTSKDAYMAITPKLGRRQEQVYETLKSLVRADNETLADALGWPINRVTGRMSELKKFDLVACVGITQTKAGFLAKVWAPKDINDSRLQEYANECEE